ncbi:MAG: glycosyltransferase [archaeon]|jgi:glycosyltransferase involved in cell wall biosynthesis
MTSVVAVVLAHNEERALPRTLRILSGFKRKGIISNIIVVNDGSEDRTALVAQKAGAIVVSHEKNMGKREGFISGAFKARELGADALISLDADIHQFSEKSVRTLIEPVISGGKLMSVGRQYEKHTTIGVGPIKAIRNLFSKNTSRKVSSRLGFLETYYGGVSNSFSTFPRAIKLTALEPIFRNNKKWMSVFRSKLVNSAWKDSYPFSAKYGGHPKQWGLERALDILVPENKVISVNAPVLSDEPFRITGRADGPQTAARLQITQEMNTRRSKAISLRDVRRKIFDAKQRNDPKAVTGLRKKLNKIKYRV